jgi:hypothetical protein
LEVFASRQSQRTLRGVSEGLAQALLVGSAE